MTEHFDGVYGIRQIRFTCMELFHFGKDAERDATFQVFLAK